MTIEWRLKIYQVLGVSCVEWNYWLLPCISFFLSESEIPLSSEMSSGILEHLKKSTSDNQKIFPICQRRCELVRISVLSLDVVFAPSTQRNPTPYWHAAWQKPNRHFQTHGCVWNLVSAWKWIPRNWKSGCSTTTVFCFNVPLFGIRPPWEQSKKQTRS
jgi:hypothetical protein